MIVDCAHYLGGARQAEETLAPLDAARLCTENGFVWLGLFEPTPEEMESVREAFDLHELAVEDAQDYHLRPKVEDFEASVKLVILRTARYDDAREEVDFGEISVFVAKNFVITVRQGVASELHQARARLEQKPELLALGTDAVLWAILDQVVDGYEPVVAGLEHDIEQIEATVFSGAVAPTERIYLLRREVTNFYRAAHPLLAVVNSVGKSLGEERLSPTCATSTTACSSSTRRSLRSATCSAPSCRRTSRWSRCSRRTRRRGRAPRSSGSRSCPRSSCR